ncbi:Organic cation transporter 1 [Orchesella cincta]|uniref:Organic cation transporter 1 n=1 Tax=Orchesella cincta TaxID=48709 RepID=A0A1D2N5L5_ORCCI|nr:Organic cation transporter 1 [Orchesella cincta]
MKLKSYDLSHIAHSDPDQQSGNTDNNDNTSVSQIVIHQQKKPKDSTSEPGERPVREVWHRRKSSWRDDNGFWTNNGRDESDSASRTKKPSLTAGSFEDILDRLGCFGPFQVITLLSYLLMEIASAFIVFIPIFVGTSPESMAYNCTTGASDEHFKVNETSNFIGSIRQMIDSPFHYKSIADEWDLRCEKAWISDVFTSCLMIGMIVGNLSVSLLADWYGRRQTYLLILCIMFFGTLMSALSPTIYIYAVARFIAGIGFCGCINVSSMAVMEFMTPKWRSLSNCLGPMGEGVMLLSCIAYFIRPWRLLYLATAVPYVLIIPIYFFLPESPRWLIRNKKLKEAHDVLGYMAKINGKEPISYDLLEALQKQEEKETESLKAKKLSYMEFVRNKSLFVTSLYLFAIWFSWNVAYYGISYNIRNVPGNLYFNVILIGLANAVGQRISMPLSDWVGRRKAVLCGMVLSAVFLVALAICFLTISVGSYLILIVCFVGLLGMSCTRAATRLLSGESFPTAVRTMGLGVGGLGANIAGVVTPQVAYLGSRWPALPFFIFSVVSVLGSLVVFMMKETKDTPLSDNVKSGNKNKGTNGNK